MTDGMPYHLEKGPTLTVIEKHLNKPDAGHKVGILGRLRAEDGGVETSATHWLADAIPGLWTDQRFLDHAPGTDDHIKRDWFGIGGQNRSTWVAYRGNVNHIVRRALRWALEVSLNLQPDDPLPGGAPRRPGRGSSCSGSAASTGSRRG